VINDLCGLCRRRFLAICREAIVIKIKKTKNAEIKREKEAEDGEGL